MSHSSYDQIMESIPITTVGAEELQKFEIGANAFLLVVVKLY